MKHFLGPIYIYKQGRLSFSLYFKRRSYNKSLGCYRQCFLGHKADSSLEQYNLILLSSKFGKLLTVALECWWFPKSCTAVNRLPVSNICLYPWMNGVWILVEEDGNVNKREILWSCCNETNYYASKTIIC